MLFYQFSICPTASEPSLAEDPGEAKVMVRVDRDVEESTEEAVQYLETLGWRVTGVRHAQMADTMEEFGEDGGLVKLYQDAARNGIACAVSALHHFASSAAGQRYPVLH